jgi:hypothetical protein
MIKNGCSNTFTSGLNNGVAKLQIYTELAIDMHYVGGSCFLHSLL